MSKIRNLFNKVFKKNQDSDDSDEFYEDVDQEIEETDEEELEFDDTREIGAYELQKLQEEEELEDEFSDITEESSDQVMANQEEEEDEFADLVFNDEPPQPDTPSVAVSEEEDEFADLVYNEDAQIIDDTDEFSDLTLNEEDTSETNSLDSTNPSLESFEDFDSDQDPVMTEEAVNEELSVLNKMAESSDDMEYTDEESDESFDYTNIKIDRSALDEEQEEIKTVEDTYPSEGDEYEIDHKTTIAEKVDLFKTKIGDKFRSFNKKDLNQALKSPSENNLQFNADSIKEKFSSFNWQEVPQKFFNKSMRNTYQKHFKTTFIASSFILTSLAIGNFFNLSKDYKNLSQRNIISLGDPNNLTKDELNQIKAAQIFKTEKIAPVKAKDKPKIAKDTICTKATKKSSASVKLINTIVLQDSVKSIASVQERSSSKLKSVRQGDNLLGQVKIDKIERLRLIVKNLRTGECESIESSKFKESNTRSNVSVLTPKASKKYKQQLKKIDGIENDGNNFKIKKEFLQDKLSDISSILTQARGIQINNPDGTISFKVVDIEPGGVFAYLGVQDNDIITHINGEPITELNQVMSLFGKIGNISNLNLTIKRGGEPLTQNYNIK